MFFVLRLRLAAGLCAQLDDCRRVRTLSLPASCAFLAVIPRLLCRCAEAVSLGSGAAEHSVQCIDAATFSIVLGPIRFSNSFYCFVLQLFPKQLFLTTHLLSFPCIACWRALHRPSSPRDHERASCPSAPRARPTVRPARLTGQLDIQSDNQSVSQTVNHSVRRVLCLTATGLQG